MELPGWVIGLIVAIGIAFYLYFLERCPKCGKALAMIKTGRKEKKGFFENDNYEVECKYCGHRVWKEESSD